MKSTKIYFESPHFGFPKTEELGKLYQQLPHVSVLETILYSCEGIFEIDEKNNKLYKLYYNDNESEKITIPFENEKSIIIYCDYSTIEKREVTKLPLHYNQMKKNIITFNNYSSLKLVIEKNILSGEVIDIYCIFDKKYNSNNFNNFNNLDFYEELKKYYKLIFNI